MIKTSAFAGFCTVISSLSTDAITKKVVQQPSSLTPQISIVTDFRSRLSDSRPGSEKLTDLKETELAFATDVDPFLRAELYIAFAKENDQFVAAVEEGFARYNNLGPGMTAKFGKIAPAIGRIQRNHADQLSFFDYPLVVQHFLGEEGIRAGGGSFSYLFPGENFHELSLEAVQPEDGKVFSNAINGRPLIVGHYRTFFDFSDDSSAQLGTTIASGTGAAAGTSRLYGVDLTYKYQPAGDKHSLVVEAESMWAKPAGSGTARGSFIAITKQVKSNLYATAKWDYSDIPGTAQFERAFSLGLTLKPTEFHHWRLAWESRSGTFGDRNRTLTLGFQWMIGAHPAHKY